MKRFFAASLLALTVVSNSAFAMTQTGEAHGTVKSDFPKQIEVTDKSGKLQTYNYAPMSNDGTNLIDVYTYDDGSNWITVAGTGRSMCMNNSLGQLKNEIDIQYVGDGEVETKTLSIPAGTPVLSTCSPGSHDMSDVTFGLKSK